MRKYMNEQLFFESISIKEIDDNLKLLGEKLNGTGSRHFEAMLDEFRDEDMKTPMASYKPASEVPGSSPGKSTEDFVKIRDSAQQYHSLTS